MRTERVPHRDAPYRRDPRDSHRNFRFYNECTTIFFVAIVLDDAY